MKLQFWLIAALVVLGGCHHPPSPPKPGVTALGVASGSVGLWMTDGGFPLVLSSDAGTLLTLQSDSFQVGTVRQLDNTLSYDPYWLLHSDATFPASSPPGLEWTQPTSVSIADGGPDALVLDLALDNGAQAQLLLSTNAPGRIDALLLPSAEPIAFLKVRLHVTATERFYGLGEWFDSVDHRGKLRPMPLEPSFTIESDDTENHVTVPLLISSNAWGIYIDSRRPGVFDVASSDPTQVDIVFGTAADSALGLPFHLFGGAAPVDLVHHYYDLTGAPRLPAPWALGPLIWRDQDTNEAQAESDIGLIRSLLLPTSAIWIDEPYATGIETFDFLPTAFPDAGSMIAYAQAEGLRVSVWHAPYEATTAEPFRAAAVDAGYFPPAAGLLTNPWSPPIDFTNPAATAYWQTQLGAYTSLGIEGFKLDYAEDVDPGIAGGRDVWSFFDGSDERTMASRYSVLYHQAYAQLLPPDGGFLLCRAGHAGDQVNGPIIWPGDIDATLTSFGELLPEPDGGPAMDGGLPGVGGVPSALRAAQTLSTSGFPFFAADTGGYRHAPANKETWIRWVEQSALQVAMETGDSSSQVPWDRDAESLSDYQLYAGLHLRLFPYVWTYATQLGSTGRPIIRPLGFAYPALVSPPDDEYLLGDSLLVAPVTEAGATSRTVVFPPGSWISWWDGSTHQGTETFPAGLDTLPLFAAAGAVVPMLRSTAQTLAVASDPTVDSFGNDAGVLTVMLFAGTGSFTVYDGTALVQTPSSLQVSPGSAFTEGVSVQWIGIAQPSDVRDGSTSVAGWSWNAAGGGTLTFALGPGTHSVTVVP